MRNRLTARLASSIKAEDQKDGLFPGDVGNLEREKNYRPLDKYIPEGAPENYEEQDLRHEWKDNPRTDNGFGISKSAKVVKVALDATKLAYIVLGDKCPEAMIEAQARDFLRLGSTRLTAALDRYAETESLYGGQPDYVGQPQTGVDSLTAPTPAEQEKTLQDNGNIVASEEEVAPEMAPAVEENNDQLPDVTTEPETIEADDADGEEEIQFENDGTMDSDDTVVEDDLQGVFGQAEETEEAVVANKVASAKMGVKKLGGQPKIASADELTGLWKSAPEM